MTENPPMPAVPTVSSRHCLALTVPFFAVITWSCALYGYLDMPNIATSVVAILFPLFCIRQVGRGWLADPGLKLQAVILLAMFAWILVCVLAHPARMAIGLGWFGVECCGLSLFLAVATSGTSSERGFMTAGVAAVGALAAALTGCLVSKSPVFGLGNSNYLMSACTPPLLAMTILVAHRLWHRRQVPLVYVVMTGAGLVVLLEAVVFSPFVRRGPLAAAAAIVVVLAVRFSYRHAPRLTVLAVVVGAGVLSHALWSVMSERLPPFRLDRVFIYRAALERIGETWALGSGPYGALLFHESAGEYARHWTSTGHWAIHSHNELLDACLSSGILGGIFWALCYGAVALRIARVADDGERTACVALFTALMVHAMTDNSYAVQAPRMMLYASLGLIFLCPTRERREDPALWTWIDARLQALPAPRPLAWIGVATGLMVALCELPGAATLCHAQPQTYLTDMRWAVLPENINQEFEACFSPLLQDGKFATAKRAVDLGVAKIGMLGPFSAAMVDLSKKRLQHVEDSPQLWAQQTPAAHDLEVRDAVEALVQALSVHPFATKAYDDLSAMLDRYPGAIAWVPARVAFPLAYITRHVDVPVQNVPETARSMDEAVTLFAQLLWWQRSGRPLAEVRSPIIDLVAGYGDQPNIALLGLALASSDRLDAVALRQLREPLLLGLVYYTPPDMQADEVTRGTHDAVKNGVVPTFSAVIAGVYPAFWADFQNHAQSGSEDDSALRDACMRLFGRAGQSAATASVSSQAH